ncbi:alpha/beta hydrolase [Aurantibacter crassamenti]|uniref:alpha/beta hydrolase family protein n=1 Tax=Aurantibacter crassamenti TaxID=1837375 RepID=UPI00193A3797|nr:alpha/beta hydrolase [Aurantibacter crassamenti]MBM1106250.1 alpha/beta hydrolase [Aurantibacter crassamenti]
MTVKVNELNIPTLKGHSIALCQFIPEKSIDKTLVISSATGVLQKYYSRFATFFSEQGFTVYTFDYYGIGKSDSSTKSLKQNSFNLKSWGKNDQAAVVLHAKNQNKNAELILITHSIGGQIMGFNPNYHCIDKIIMVASQSGYWKYFSGIHLPKMYLLWNLIIPVLTPIFGYFPAKHLGLFENLPKNMVYEWAKWGRQKDYMMHFHNADEYYFDKIKSPLLALSFTDDNYAPKNTVDWLTKQYSNAKSERIHFEKAINSDMVKHFGFFKNKFKIPLWEMTLKWILDGTIPHE